MKKKKPEQETASLEPTEPAKKKKWPKILTAVILSVILVAASVVVGALVYLKKNFDYNYNDSLPTAPEDLGFEEVKDDEIVNIALFGVDTRNDASFKGRSDTIIIMSLNKTDKKVKLISVLRDTFTPIENNGKTTYSKINSAYATGGPALAIKTLNTDFDLDISEYATINFNGLIHVVDAMGGIELEIVKNEISYINEGVKSRCKREGIDPEPLYIKTAGKQHLSGIQVLEYSRIRYTQNFEGTNNDYGRTDRQRYVLEQLFNKALSLKKSQYMDVIKSLMPYCETSLSFGQIMLLATEMLEGNAPEFSETRVPFTDYLMTRPQTSAGWVVYYDLNFAAKLIHSYIYNDMTPEEYIALNGIEKNDWYRSGFIPPQIDHESLFKTEDTSSAVETESAQGG